MAEQSRACWGCGKEPPDGVKFQRCMRCAEAKLPSSYFCGEACMLANWPRHKAWHKEVKRISADQLSSEKHTELNQRVAKQAAQLAETGGEYEQLTVEGVSLCNAGDFSGSSRIFRRLIKMKPECPDAYMDLAVVMSRCSKVSQAVPLWLKAMECYEAEAKDEGSSAFQRGTSVVQWAQCVHKVFSWVVQEPEVPTPEWWNDEGLKALSARVVNVLPDDWGALAMRAQVLSGHHFELDVYQRIVQPWGAGPRTADDMKEAAVMFRRSAVSDDAISKHGVEAIAGKCDEVANRMLAAAEAEAATARAAAEAEAAAARAAAETEARAAREVAEAKAAAAAEELLAEEEKEKEQALAAAKIKDGNAKGKGKKGKGKRS